MATDHRIELGISGQLGEVAAELIEGGGFGRTLATAAGGHLGRLAQHADHLGAHLGEINAEVFQDPGSDALTFADQAQQQVLGADVVVTQLAGFLQGQLENTFGPGGEGDLHGHEAGAPADDLLDFHPGILEVDPHGLEDLGGHAGALTDQTQQDLLRANEVVSQAAGLFLGQHDHLDGLLGKPLEHGQSLVQVHPTYQG